MKASWKMKNSILKLVKQWTNDLTECDGRNLNGVAITLKYDNEIEKEAPADFYDFCEVIIQDVRWDGSRNRFERDTYFVNHDGEIQKF